MGTSSGLLCSRCQGPIRPISFATPASAAGRCLLNTTSLKLVNPGTKRLSLRAAQFVALLACSARRRFRSHHLDRRLDPACQTAKLERELGATNLWVKDEGRNPTDSFKARGLSCAVTMARKFGVRKIAIPSAGNAASALAAYAAAAGLKRISSCRATYRNPISSSARPTARMSPWSTA